MKKVRYQNGYNHYDHRRTKCIHVLLNEAELAALNDLMAALGYTNKSRFVRAQIFSAHRSLTPTQRRKLQQVAKWRAQEQT